MPQKLKYRFTSVFVALYSCSLFPSPQQESSVPASCLPASRPSAKDINASIELTAVDVDHIGFKVHIDGWREGLIVQDIQLQDASGSMIELETMFLTKTWKAPDWWINMISCLLPPGRFIGHIILRVAESPDVAPLHMLKFDLHLVRCLFAYVLLHRIRDFDVF